MRALTQRHPRNFFSYRARPFANAQCLYSYGQGIFKTRFPHKLIHRKSTTPPLNRSSIKILTSEVSFHFVPFKFQQASESLRKITYTWFPHADVITCTHFFMVDWKRIYVISMNGTSRKRFQVSLSAVLQTLFIKVCIRIGCQIVRIASEHR